MPAGRFEIVSQTRPFAVVSPGFEAAAAGPARLDAMHRSDASPPAPFAAVEVELDDVGPGGAAAGLTAADGDGVLVTYEPARHQVRVRVTRAGRQTVVARKRVRGAPPRRLGFVLCENQVTALLDRRAGWQPVVTARQPVSRLLDLRDPAVLGRLAYAWGPAEPAAGPVALRGVVAGVFGMTGVRDPHLVQAADGTPYVRDGQVYLTMTCAGMGFFAQAHWGVFTLDLAAPDRLTQVGHLFSRRDGLVLGDHAGQVIVDDATGRCRVATSSWGDFSPKTGVHLRHAEATTDLLHGVHVLDYEPFAVPTPHSAWDPALTRVDDRWRVAFVESPSQDPFDFHPALAAGPPGGAWGEGLELVGADTTLDQCEGPILAQVDGEWRVLASDERGRRYVIYDLGMRRVGELAAPYVTNIPHPQLLPLPESSPLGGELMVTFDGTSWGKRVLGYGTHGDFIVMAR